jgi:hypothetical protein
MAAPLSPDYFSERPPTLLGSRALYRFYTDLLLKPPKRSEKNAHPMSFNPLAANQTVLFLGQRGQGLSYMVEALRQQYLRTQSALLELDAWYYDPSLSFEPAVRACGRESALTVVGPALYPARYEATLQHAIESKSCLYWGMPDFLRLEDLMDCTMHGPRQSWSNPVFENLATVLEQRGQKRPALHNQMLIILNDINLQPPEQIERVIKLAKRAGASIWAVTRSLGDSFDDAGKLHSLFDSFFLASQVNKYDLTLSERLCHALPQHRELATALGIEATTFARLRAGRFIWLGQNRLEVGQMTPLARSPY